MDIIILNGDGDLLEVHVKSIIRIDYYNKMIMVSIGKTSIDMRDVGVFNKLYDEWLTEKMRRTLAQRQ